jgi:hypothetical protein
MHFIYLQQAGKPVDNSSGDFWVLAGVAVPANSWKTLQIRVNGLTKSFLRDNYRPRASILDANSLLHPRHADKAWTLGLCKGLEKIVAGMQLRLFLVVVDKRTTDKPAHGRWILPLAYNYLHRPITQFLRERDSQGCLVLPPGRPDELAVLSEVQHESTFGGMARNSLLLSSPMIQSPEDACGLQVADFVATIARRYQEQVFPKLFARETLHGYDAIVNSHYQGFVKPNTYQSAAMDPRGYRIRGYIYLWRREMAGRSRDDDEGSGHAEAGTSPSEDLLETRMAN